ncbi:hypothetical protein BRC82_09840 [Halobacteriales archaeon QS_1_67_19]|nr:MAG: hypothetical protein BRC82_09840 [Halobacteriales archaeon QS_1_67_19]
MTDASMAGKPDAPSEPLPTATDAMHLTLDLPFEDAVPYVQLEHEYVGFETVNVTRLDRMVAAVLDDDPPRTALLVVCHAEVARDALSIDPRLAGLLPCTTAVYEDPDDDRVHVHHISATKAMRDLGCAPAGTEADVEALVELTGGYMATVWDNIEANADTATAD